MLEVERMIYVFIGLCAVVGSFHLVAWESTF